MVDRWRECATESQTVGKSWGRDLFCSPLLRFTVPLSHSFPVYFYPSSLPPSLTVWLPWLGCDLFCSLLMLSVAILRGLLAMRMDSVYTLASSAASHQRCHGWVCVRWAEGGVFKEKERARETERWHVDKHGFTPHSQDNFTIYLLTETLKAPWE